MAKIIIGVTGSIAAYKMIKLTHDLIKEGHEVRIILTPYALKFVTPASFSAFGADVFLDDRVDDCNSKVMMQHINLAKWPDLIIVSPATANIIAKLANGIADNLLLSTILATVAKILIAPAMNKYMWSHWTMINNVKQLSNHGVEFLGPVSGLQACGDDGEGRLIEPEDILTQINEYLILKPITYPNLSAKKVVITLGSTKENIDPIRFISNNSSGKMGYALANACKTSCRELVIIAGGNVKSCNNLDSYKIIYVDSADEMANAAINECANADIFISCAAVCDYKIEEYSEQKLKKTEAESLTLKLVKNIDIVSYVKKQFPNLFVVGFAAETENLIEYAKQKIKTKNLDLIIANEVRDNKVFNSDYNEVFIIDKNSSIKHLAKSLKTDIAKEIFSSIDSLLAK